MSAGINKKINPIALKFVSFQVIDDHLKN